MGDRILNLKDTPGLVDLPLDLKTLLCTKRVRRVDLHSLDPDLETENLGCSRKRRYEVTDILEKEKI